MPRSDYWRSSPTLSLSPCFGGERKEGRRDGRVGFGLLSANECFVLLLCLALTTSLYVMNVHQSRCNKNVFLFRLSKALSNTHRKSFSCSLHESSQPFKVHIVMPRA